MSNCDVNFLHRVLDDKDQSKTVAFNAIIYLFMTKQTRCRSTYFLRFVFEDVSWNARHVVAAEIYLADHWIKQEHKTVRIGQLVTAQIQSSE